MNTGGNKAGATLISIPYISPNPGACLFQAVSCDIGEENMSNTQNIAQTNTLYRSLYESKTEQETVNATNPIRFMTLYDAYMNANNTSTLAEYFSHGPNA